MVSWKLICWVLASLLVGGFTQLPAADIRSSALKAALVGDFDDALGILDEPDPSILRCVALLQLARGSAKDALESLNRAKSIADSADGARGGCPELQSSFFSAAVTLMRLRDEGAYLPTCDERVSMSAELEALGLTNASLVHLGVAAALSSAIEHGETPTCTHSQAAIAVHDALVCPHHFDSLSDIAFWRNRVKTKVAAVLRRCKDGDLSLNDLSSFSNPGTFDLVYQGFNDKDMMRNVASMYACLNPRLTEPQPPKAFQSRYISRAEDAASLGPLLRVGFLSAHFRTHSVCKLFCGVAQSLPRTEFEVFVILASDAQDAMTVKVCEGASKILRLTNGDQHAANAVLSLNLDVVVYPSIGMHQASYLWAMGRLALVTVATWGHPVTSGLPSVDYFVSSDAFASIKSDERLRFSEQLVRFESLSFVFTRPPGADAVLAAPPPDLGAFSPGVPVVVVPQALMKLHPSFDRAVGLILKGAPTAKLALLHDPRKTQHVAWKGRLMRRFSAALGSDATGRIVFLPRLNSTEFLGLMRRATVMLDPFPFGGGVTSLEGFSVCAPIVTAPALQSVPQLAAGMYRRMGIMDAPIADSTIDSFASLVLYLVKNSTARDVLVANICENRAKLFNDGGSASEWASFLHRVTGFPVRTRGE